MNHLVNAAARDFETYGRLFFYTFDVPGTGEVLGGIDCESNSGQLPAPEDLIITLANP